MTMPLVQKETVIAYIKARIPRSPKVEVTGIYPSNDAVVNYGIYVDDIQTEGRTAYKVGVTKAGSIYTKEDVFKVLYVTFQDDVQSDQVQSAIELMADDAVFWDGYHEVDYTRVTEVGNKSEKHTYTYSLKRIDFNA